MIKCQRPTTNYQLPVKCQKYYAKRVKSLGWLQRQGSPLPIPNREVKPACADGTATRGRVGRRQSFYKILNIQCWGFFFDIAHTLTLTLHR